MQNNFRPPEYQYYNLLKKHLKNNWPKIFKGKFLYPRQLEIHPPGNHQIACNFNCPYCEGKLLNQPLVSFETEALELIDRLRGKIPHIIYSGLYTEPLLNPYLLAFINATKKHGSSFGLHTNGSLLKTLEEIQGWLTELCHLSTSNDDYISISLDAGTPKSHTKTKKLKKNWFDEIVDGIKMLVQTRGKNRRPTVRICYLLNKDNSSKKEIKSIIQLSKQIKVDSLRFSIPYDLYGRSFNKVKTYKETFEIKQHQKLIKILQPLMSKDLKEKPYIFYFPPKYQDVEVMNFPQCIYGYYQITLGADGYFYRCSSTTSPTFKKHRFGKITTNLKKFNKMILENQSPKFNPLNNCFKCSARCTRAALELNTKRRDVEI